MNIEYLDPQVESPHTLKFRVQLRDGWCCEAQDFDSLEAGRRNISPKSRCLAVAPFACGAGNLHI